MEPIFKALTKIIGWTVFPRNAYVNIRTGTQIGLFFLVVIMYASAESQSNFFGGDDENGKSSLPTFQQVITNVRPLNFRTNSQERYLDDVDLSVREESLSSVLAMKTGYVYLGGMQ